MSAVCMNTNKKYVDLNHALGLRLNYLYNNNNNGKYYYY